VITRAYFTVLLHFGCIVLCFLWIHVDKQIFKNHLQKQCPCFEESLWVMLLFWDYISRAIRLILRVYFISILNCMIARSEIIIFFAGTPNKGWVLIGIWEVLVFFSCSRTSDWCILLMFQFISNILRKWVANVTLIGAYL
jgi:hypothetical protein